MKQESWDDLHLANEKSITKILETGEQVLFSSLLYKFNEVNKRQERTILITTHNLYNLSKLTVKRKIPIKRVYGITVGLIGTEFVVHVPEEYDYRYSSSERRDYAVLCIIKAYCQQNKGAALPIFYKDELTLTAYTTTKVDKKKGINRLPTTGSELMNEDQFRKRLDSQTEERLQTRAKTSTLYAKQKGEVVTIDDFDLIKVLGRGAYGKVMLVEKKSDKQYYAMKSIRKEDIADPEQLEHTKTERIVLEHVNHPFLVSLNWAFQTPEKLFFITQFMKGGELFQHLKHVKRFEESRTKFYVSEIILALEHLHSKNIIYRDLKPENVLLDDQGHVCLTDFGMAKILKKNELAKSFCGTPEYLAPEILLETGHSMAADWWALGILTYEMLYALPPFYNKNQDLMFKQIQTKDISFPTTPQISMEAKDFIQKLTIKDPKFRIGYSKTEDVKNHAWFKGVNWEKLLKKEVETPFKPQIQGEAWLENFDKQFTAEEAINSYAPENNLVSQDEFREFDYYQK
ncbi:unnamed protein product (macronuclear) [Paramecium tetraurelia]|uniref:Protein kinase domain-containing protein n=1 Tax=Paramecium tetraurelia TaxID=5888 RepID=A0DXZ0_PARTE|nr:uncharacterized protein GSPATT00021531001 [Paramecium tetraurelia]CAK87907.1 unnamed protein product [Paramecium tetraurelia]|eukprot:XP_001455304.1 hypothetical protein (macronuclear) [Paramecium tetraurelia strain d4-2]